MLGAEQQSGQEARSFVLMVARLVLFQYRLNSPERIFGDDCKIGVVLDQFTFAVDSPDVHWIAQ